MRHLPAFSLVGILCSGVMWGGCTNNLGLTDDSVTKLEVEEAITKYYAAAQEVKIGDSKEKVLNLLLPTQEGLHRSLQRRRDSFMSGLDLIEVYYFRTVLPSGGKFNHDEFTPYVFKRKILTSIGWPALGDRKAGILKWGYHEQGVRFSDLGLGGC